MAKKKTKQAEWVGGKAMNVVVWFDATNVIIRGVFEAPETVVGALEAAIDGSSVGVPRSEPASIRVADRATCDAIKKRYGDRFSVKVGPTPELEQVLTMLASMAK